jgi:hypothetical protein
MNPGRFMAKSRFDEPIVPASLKTAVRLIISVIRGAGETPVGRRGGIHGIRMRYLDTWAISLVNLTRHQILSKVPTRHTLSTVTPEPGTSAGSLFHRGFRAVVGSLGEELSKTSDLRRCLKAPK